MATRENQGLQIALIVCAILIVVLGVATFWVYNISKDETLRAQNAVRDAKKADENALKAANETTQLKQLMGYGAKDDVSTILANYKKDIETFAATMRESEQNYRNIVSQLAAELQKQVELLVDAETRNQQLQSDFKAKETASLAEIEQYKVGLKQAKDDLEQERAKFTVDRTRTLKEGADLVHKLEDRKKEFDDKTAKSTRELDDVEKALRTAKTTIDALVSTQKEQEISTEMPDGKVTWVNQGSRLVWLNVGSEDGLRRQISFSVIGSDEMNPVKAEKKGTVEVIRVLDAHSAEARIMDDDPSKPIQRGDQLFSVAWRPNHAEHFALVGLMDLDKDGISDLEKVKTLITVNGGIVDAELRDDGKRVGQMTVDTRYLVLGEEPTDKNKSGDYLDGYSKMRADAKSLPIKTISLRDLLGYLGYKDHERTVPLGNDAKAADFVPRPPDGVPRRSNNESFKNRRVTPSGKTDTVY